MVAVESTMLPLGTRAPEFTLPDPASGAPVSLDDIAGENGTLVVFMCNHCPYVKHLRHALSATTHEYAGRGISSVGINSNDVERYPADGPEAMIREKEEAGYAFPYLLDETQEVARAYRAACTPDFFLFDAERRLAYRGQFDGSRPGSGAPVTGEDLRAAMEALLEGRSPPEEQSPSIGCNIKWKPGNAPDWFGG